MRLESGNLAAGYHGAVHAMACSMVGVFRLDRKQLAPLLLALVIFGDVLFYFGMQASVQRTFTLLSQYQTYTFLPTD